jgi:hypothetical protein
MTAQSGKKLEVDGDRMYLVLKDRMLGVVWAFVLVALGGFGVGIVVTMAIVTAYLRGH